MSGCIFCDIVNGKAPASIIFRDEGVMAFLDIRPVNPGHLLVVPRQHASNLAELNPLIGGQLFLAGQMLAGALYHSGIRCEGVNFFLADGVPAGQEVFHVHLHVFPRYVEDGFGLTFSPAYFSSTPARDELDRCAALIRDSLNR